LSTDGPVGALGARVLGFFRGEARRFGLDPATLAIEYVLNPGGFVNHSWRVRDARRRLHLKLSTGPEQRAALARWHALGPLLAARHRAPTVLAWIDLDETAGLLFDHLPGRAPSLSRPLLEALLVWQAALSSDDELREALLREPLGENPHGGLPTALDVYEEGLGRRAREDLAGIRRAPPDFLSPDTLAWMGEEAASLHDAVARASCFAEELRTPAHGDLWLENLLASPEGGWHVLDWDELAIGDPVLDLATVTGPSLGDLTPLKLRETASEALGPAERERLGWLGRATLLDWVIDPLADWVEAVVAPRHLAEVRADKERQHRAALALYGRLYGRADRAGSAPRG
jgi:hypothetical protein